MRTKCRDFIEFGSPIRQPEGVVAEHREEEVIKGDKSPFTLPLSLSYAQLADAAADDDCCGCEQLTISE